MASALAPRPLCALLAVAARLERAGVDWLLAGGAARALLGMPGRVADLDVEVAPAGAATASAALGIGLGLQEGRGRASWRGRGEIAGVEVDLTCDLEVEGPGGRLRPDFALQRGWATPVTVAGARVWLAPIEESLARALVQGDWARLARIAGEAGAAGERAPALRAAYLGPRLASAAARAAR